MQLLIIRHALPLRSEPGRGSDPDLSEEGVEQAKRLPDALARFPISRLVSSPQRRAIQTAQPVADALGLQIGVDDRLAEYDRDLSHYTPVEEISEEDMRRLANGELPSGVDQSAFLTRVKAGVADIVRAADREDTVALFSHGGVINALVHDVMCTERLLCVQVDYAGITRLLWSSSRETFFVAGVNATEHVWDLLPRNQQW
ncbi:phosphoglycerate kinase [Mycolicibacterium celeriflavum]|uniref:Phosphoglycerate mutase n=1 Tax=Mycolicibacterium celeriflavum TaxID=1249101 RepID=A0A1X0C0Y9_MYCCF|nr:histidine phosphatase family protein [Mycolicibacterium celeriflavum]MCV7238930.1 histidine phosphatase family protein [Mycolicibacterium celeriflavum]OBG18509.1 phosphoglycerate kinase [Mycolicibacterium celeriflavum]ORA50507.1 histidine phosphatase family protein [Mycolicibacterium celeriflavum]BBY45169.1 phosphoglycerate mutase [Mycolicibacterium celeriflavum]